MTASSDPAAFLPFANALADAARAITQKYWRQPVAVDHKADDSPVTIADREIESRLRAMIAEAFPEHGIEGEEFGAAGTDRAFVWHLDPIDGTKAFISGRPLFGTLIALAHEGVPVLGVIDHAVMDERWVGLRGAPTTWNGRAIQTRPCSRLDQAILALTHPDMFVAPEERAGFAAVDDAVRLTVFGGDCYNYGLLAQGFIDLVLEASLDIHDFMALVPVIEGAGGVMTDWQGAPLGRGSAGRVLAAGDPTLHSQTLALLQTNS
jgi:histidinol phosphatase-like enzyme (inositol monophosphatase family)